MYSNNNLIMKKYYVISYNGIFKFGRHNAISEAKKYFNCTIFDAKIMIDSLFSNGRIELSDEDYNFWVNVAGIVLEPIIDYPELSLASTDIEIDGKIFCYSEEEYNDLVIEANNWYSEQPKEIRKLIAILRNENPRYVAPIG